MVLKTYIYFINPEMIEGNTEFEHQLFFSYNIIIMLNSLASEYKHMAILFSKENDTNEWMILFLLKIIYYTYIGFTQFKKLNIKIYISSK